MTAYVLQLTEYDPLKWSSAQPCDARFWHEFAAFARNSVPVCHNPSFDRAFIALSAAAVGVDDLGLDYHWIGTESLAWPLYRMGHAPQMSLDGLCEFFRLPLEPRPHEALKGAQTCLQVYSAIMARYASVL